MMSAVINRGFSVLRLLLFHRGVFFRAVVGQITAAYQSNVIPKQVVKEEGEGEGEGGGIYVLYCIRTYDSRSYVGFVYM